MKTSCAPDNIACLFDKVMSDPMAILGQPDTMTLAAIWIGVCIVGSIALTRKG